MTDSTPQLNFRQFPPALKFVVLWMGLISLFYLQAFLQKAFLSLRIDIFTFTFAFTYITLSNGLFRGSNGSRIWSGVIVSVGTLYRVILLISMTRSLPLGYEIYGLSITHTQKIDLLILSLVFNAILLYILLRPSTKALFTSQPAPIPAPQEPA